MHIENEQAVLTPRSSSKHAAVRPLDKLWEQISRERVDLIGHSSQMRFDWSEEMKRFTFNLSNTDPNKPQFEFPTNRHFNKKMYGKLAKGLSSLSDHLVQTDQKPLLTQIVNEQFERDPRKFLVRSQQNEAGLFVARAFCGDTYKPIDDDLILETMIPVIEEHDTEYVILGGRATMERTYFNIVTKDPVVVMPTANGDREVHLGTSISNSGTGDGAFEGSFFACDAYCLNGLRFGQQNHMEFRQVHRGSKISQEYGKLQADSFRKAELASLKVLIADATRAALDPKKHAEFAEILKESHKAQVTGDPIEVIKRVGTENKFSDIETKIAQMAMQNEEANLYGVQAAVTRMAQEVESFSRRVKLEEIAGKLVTLPTVKRDSLLATTAPELVS
tara:strand:+ start:2795 stop:3964 length:1170 start_codon:yes stop_codon:yes gene_type:complete